MKLFSRELSLLILFSIPLFAQTSLPITTPIEWKGLDTLSKFYQFEQFKKRYSPKKDSNEETRIPFKKDGEDGILDLITDPRVVYSSYFGGNGYDCSYGIAVDSKDNMILVGYSGSTNLPTTTGCFQKEKSGSHDAFIAKFTSDGQPVWITYYGGSGTDVAKGCVIDKDDNIYVVGKTNSQDFPVTKGKFNGFDTPDAFILKFSPTGERIWSVLYGSSHYDTGEGIALMSDGGVVIAGYTNGNDLPVTDGLLFYTWQGNADAFIARFSSDGDLVWGTYYGGYQNEISTCIATDKNDNIAVGGYHQTVSNLPNKYIFPTTPDAFQKDTSGGNDCFIIMLTGNCSLKYATLYGGRGDDVAKGITIDNSNGVYFCGYTKSENFPISDDAYQKKYAINRAFITKFSSNQRAWSTYYGGDPGNDPGGNEADAITFDKNDNIWITGATNCPDFPVIGDSIHGITSPFSIGGTRIILMKMDLNGKPIYSAYYGSKNSFGFAVFSNSSRFLITGETNATKFPYTNNAFQNRIIPAEYTSYLVKIDLNRTDVENLEYNGNKSIYPNPFERKIRLTNLDIPCDIKIYDLFGVLITEIYLQDAENPELDLNWLRAGFYQIIIQSNKSIYSNKLLKLY